MKSEIKVWSVGTPVQVGPYDNRHDGTITGIHIGDSGVEYDVSWWDGNDRNTERFVAGEISGSARGIEHEQTIGFHTRMDKA